MFDFDVGKLLLIGVVALIFIPPKDLPEALRMLGRMISQARRMASDFQSQFSEALREAELSDLKDQLHDLKNKASVEGAFDHVASLLEQPVKPAAGNDAAAGQPATPHDLAMSQQSMSQDQSMPQAPVMPHDPAMSAHGGGMGPAFAPAPVQMVDAAEAVDNSAERVGAMDNSAERVDAMGNSAAETAVEKVQTGNAASQAPGSAA